MLNNWKFFRQLIGGVWWKVRYKFGNKVQTRWVRFLPRKEDEIIDSEDYIRWNGNRLDDCNFYQSISNIPTNGGWKDSLNLSKYLRYGRLLRQRGLEDQTIILILTELYLASLRENYTSLPPKTYSWASTKKILSNIQND